MPRLLIPTMVAMAVACTGAMLLVPAGATARDQASPTQPIVAECKGQESNLAMARVATRAITLDLSPCTDLGGDEKSRCQKAIRVGYDAAVQAARNAEKAAKKALTCCQKPTSKGCRATTKKR